MSTINSGAPDRTEIESGTAWRVVSQAMSGNTIPKTTSTNDSGSGLETFIAQKYGEGAAIKQQAGDQNKIP